MIELIDLRHVVALLRRYWMLLVAGAFVGAVLGGVLAYLRPSVHTAEITMLVGTSTQDIGLDRTDVEASILIADIYADLAIRQPILQSTISELGLDTTWPALRDDVRVVRQEDSQLLEIRVSSAVEAEALATVDQIGQQLILASPNQDSSTSDGVSEQELIEQRRAALGETLEQRQARVDELEAQLAATLDARREQIEANLQVAERMLLDSEDALTRLLEIDEASDGPNSISVLEPARLVPASRQLFVVLTAIVTAAIGLMLAGLGALLLNRRRDRLETHGDLVEGLGIPVLGVIAGERFPSSWLDALESSPAAHSDQLTNIHLVGGRMAMAAAQEDWAVVIAPLRSDRRVADMATTLGVMVARSGLPVAVVDADLKSATVNDACSVEVNPGLSNLLEPAVASRDLLKKTSEPLLTAVTVGDGYATPYEVYSSVEFIETLDELERGHVSIICIGPPLDGAPESLLLSRHVGSVVITVRQGDEKFSQLKEAVESLQKFEVEVLGVVMLNEGSPGGE